VFVAVNRIHFGMFEDLTEAANELIGMLAPRSRPCSGSRR
jgi:hypothetical protein